MARLATDADFNKDDRAIEMKIEIYFDEADPLVVTTDNYLIDAELLEESGSDDDWLLGAVSANEISINLYSEDSIFNPNNKEGPYYGKIDTGIIIKPFIRPIVDGEEIEWIELGVFEVSEWQASITGVTAMITANDTMQDFFNADKLELQVSRDISYKQLYEGAFGIYSRPIRVSEYLDTKRIPWAFMEETNAKFVQHVAIATACIVNAARDGVVAVKHISEYSTLRASISDENQIVDADSMQSISKQFKGCAVYYSSPQLTSNTKLLEIRKLKVPVGMNTHEKFTFSASNMYQITNIVVEAEQRVTVQGYYATPNNIVLLTYNTGSTEAEVDITVYGTHLEHVEVTLKDEETAGNILEVRNNYIQTEALGTEFKQTLDKVIDSKVPELTVQIRGNPLLQIGDKLRVQSSRYKLDYIGNIKRSVLRYDGGLSGSVVLVDSSLLGGV